MFLVSACGGGNTPPAGTSTAGGAERSPRTATLETGANLLQNKAPVEQISIYLDGFHLAKDDPSMQSEAHHYCNQVNEDFAQCVIFDGNTSEARLVGIEYIISAPLHATLAADERAYWHPHNYEILSGQLQMPGLPEVTERAALRDKVNSYGKTWHTWMAGMPDHPPDRLPLGPARLQWSFNRDGEIRPDLLTSRDQRMQLDTAAERAARQELASAAQPQAGVNALAARGGGDAVPGVEDSGDLAAYPVPVVSMESGRRAPY